MCHYGRSGKFSATINCCLYISLSPVSVFAWKICVNAPVSIIVSVHSSLYLQVTRAELLSAFPWHLILGSSEKISNIEILFKTGQWQTLHMKTYVWSCMHLEWTAINIWPCYGSGSQSLASYYRGPGSIPGQSKQQVFSKHFGFPLSSSSSSQNAQYSVVSLNDM